MTRVQVIQAILDHLGAKVYLEIGVQSGDTFLPLKARKKIAVDPQFLISKHTKFDWLRWNAWNAFNEYYPMTSDAFFKTPDKTLRARLVDVAFVDGLHTYEQSLADVQNCLSHLRQCGVIVVDDCSPTSEGAACPIKGPTLKLWNGDVWKTIVHLRSTRIDLNVFTLDCVYGLGIITNGAAESMLSYSLPEINSLTYEDLDADRERILNLKPSTYLTEFLPSRVRLPLAT